MTGVLSSAPTRAPTWLLGAPLGVQVWQIHGDPEVVAVLVGCGGPVVLLGSRIADTAAEGDALRWAFERIADAHGESAYFERRPIPPAR